MNAQTSTVVKNNESMRDLISFSAFSTLNGGDSKKSLNLGVRKRENERIEAENYKFAQKLYTNSGCISRKQLDQEYLSILAYKKMISRVKKNKPSFNGRF
jgi:hypothetical protein